MLIATTCRGKKAAFNPQDISAFTETEKGGVYVYVGKDSPPFHADCTFAEFLEMYETALSCTTPGHISSIREAPQAVFGPPSTETPEQRAHRLGRLEKFQQDLRLMFPEAYVFVKTWDGNWAYNTLTSVVATENMCWKEYLPLQLRAGADKDRGWKTVDSEICDAWREELLWLHWGASMFYGQRHI